MPGDRQAEASNTLRKIDRSRSQCASRRTAGYAAREVRSIEAEYEHKGRVQGLRALHPVFMLCY